MMPSFYSETLGITVPLYPIILTPYVVMAIFLTCRLNEEQGISSNYTLNSFAIGAPVGFVGAHLLDVLEYPEKYPTLGHILRRGGGSSIASFAASRRTTPAVILPCLCIVGSGARSTLSSDTFDATIPTSSWRSSRSTPSCWSGARPSAWRTGCVHHPRGELTGTASWFHEASLQHYARTCACVLASDVADSGVRVVSIHDARFAPLPFS